MTMLGFLKRLVPHRHPLRLAWHRTKAFAAAARYGFPARKLIVIGVTGTDGKTTTVGMLAHLLRKCGRSVGAASTAFLQVNEEFIPNDSHLTSISPVALQAFLRRLVKEGCTHAVIEMSSHGLVQSRMAYTWPRIAAITNVSPEHLDYHGSMLQYQSDKGIIFSMLDAEGVKVLNGGDPSAAFYEKIPSKKTLVYNHDQGNLWATDVAATPSGSTALLHYLGNEVTLHLSVPGLFNVENAQCAIGCAIVAGLPFEPAVSALATFHGIPGRMERIDEGQPFALYVDFAVSPQAYRKTLETLRKIAGDAHRVLVLCGSCGNRMRAKRPEVGRACSDLADVVVATEDETYGEDPHKVLDELWAGVEQAKTEAHKIFDRREAIKFILQAAQPGDAVVLCGMGPFATMTKLEGRIPWDERDIARDLLRELGAAAQR